MPHVSSVLVLGRLASFGEEGQPELIGLLGRVRDRIDEDEIILGRTIYEEVFEGLCTHDPIPSDALRRAIRNHLEDDRLARSDWA